MKIISKNGDPRFAMVYVASVGGDPKKLIEFVDALDPRYPKALKWVIIVSTQIGCPVSCLMCDSGTYFYGNLTKEEMFEQIDHVLTGNIFDHPKLKIQFARMGEPGLNPAVLDVLEELPQRYKIKGLMPCIATTAPDASAAWFDRLIEIKNGYYSGGHFQLQFSLNSTSEAERDIIMPIKKWSLRNIADYGDRYYKNGDRKITLNFALAKDFEIDANVLAAIFDPNIFLVKITPVNPTDTALESNFKTVVSHETPLTADAIVEKLNKKGFETIISIGSYEEIKIGSNCGQSTRRIHYGRQDYNEAKMAGQQTL